MNNQVERKPMSHIAKIRNLAGASLVAASTLTAGCGYRITNESERPTATPTMTTEQQIGRAVSTAVAGALVSPKGAERLRVAPEATRVAPSIPQVASGQRESVVDHEMKSGETFRARDGSMIKGDVSVNGVRLYDDNENTGLIVELHQDAEITALWGANVSEVGADQTTRNAVFGQAVEEMKAKGCVNGCDRVDVVKYPGGQPQGK